ncbi:unnamed protein product [Anisakis simplex]|uniref:AraC family transcriptional regulator n=1 Tax=Anisakis simplex TaxID=6269 RepID=A0A0M3IZK6_ANISI|nr:unnamed protein product [Anisakis simplex]
MDNANDNDVIPSSIIRLAEILQPIPDNTLRLCEQVEMTEGRIPLQVSFQC